MVLVGEHFHLLCGKKGSRGYHYFAREGDKRALDGHEKKYQQVGGVFNNPLEDGRGVEAGEEGYETFGHVEAMRSEVSDEV